MPPFSPTGSQAQAKHTPCLVSENIIVGDSLRSKPTDLESLSEDTDLGISFRLIKEIF